MLEQTQTEVLSPQASTEQLPVSQEEKNFVAAILNHLSQSGYVVTEQLRHRAHSFEILVELLSTGYVVSEEVMKAILTLGDKYQVSKKAQSCIETAFEKAKNVDEQYHLTEKAISLDEKFGLKQKVSDCAVKASELGTQALQTSYGQRVAKLVEYVLSLHTESKKLADNKKKHRNSIEGELSSNVLEEPAR